MPEKDTDADSGSAKDKFRDALGRKRGQQHADNGRTQADSKVHAQHGKAGAKRQFRRKSG
jgi:Family of unknown function (DUF5302)